MAGLNFNFSSEAFLIDLVGVLNQMGGVLSLLLRLMGYDFELPGNAFCFKGDDRLFVRSEESSFFKERERGSIEGEDLRKLKGSVGKERGDLIKGESRLNGTN